ncbi:hypothetical protein Pfo_000410 [Paulownia fortunei]|nr:hypothetical protein Pfo_000410 [Paulownia fortunei]
MASLSCKLVAQIVFMAVGDAFHRLLTNNPQHLAKVTPPKLRLLKFRLCDLHQGSYGTNGSVVQWKYTLDGKEQTAKQVIEDIDEEKKQIAYKFIEGDLLELYKNFVVKFHIETKGGIDFITWTIEYELLNADNPHPISVLKFLIEFTKEIEAHIFG